MSGERRLFHGNAGLFRQLDHGVSGNPFQNARIGGRRFENPIFDDEDIIARALSHVALIVEHDRLVVAEVLRLDLGQNIVQIIERFDGGRQRGWVAAASRHSYDGEAIFVKLLRVELDGIGDDEITDLNIPTGVPLHYKLDENLQPVEPGGRYLDPDAAKAGADAVASQGKH